VIHTTDKLETEILEAEEMQEGILLDKINQVAKMNSGVEI